MELPTSGKRHRPEEVVAKLRQADESRSKGVTIADVARSRGVSEVTLRRWRAKYGAFGRDVVRRLTELEKENARLKRLVADQQLDIQILTEVAKGGTLSPVRRQRAIDQVTAVMDMSECRECRAVSQHRSTHRRPTPANPYGQMLVSQRRRKRRRAPSPLHIAGGALPIRRRFSVPLLVRCTVS